MQSWNVSAREPRGTALPIQPGGSITPKSGSPWRSWKWRHDSLDIHEKAKVIQQRLIDRYPDNLAYKKGFAENLVAIGFAHHKRKDNSAALKTFHEVQDFCQSLLKEVSYGPKPIWLLNSLAAFPVRHRGYSQAARRA